MNYANIKKYDISNGTGVRVSLYVSGCRNHCKGCFNPETWDFNYGKRYTSEIEEELLQELRKPYIKGITILGGEPMEPENQKYVYKLIEKIRNEFKLNKSIWIFSGYKIEELLNKNNNTYTEFTNKILDNIDILVDGKFIEELKNISLRFRGSENQRIIDMNKTRENYSDYSNIILWKGMNNRDES